MYLYSSLSPQTQQNLKRNQSDPNTHSLSTLANQSFVVHQNHPSICSISPHEILTRIQLYVWNLLTALISVENDSSHIHHFELQNRSTQNCPLLHTSLSSVTNLVKRLGSKTKKRELNNQHTIKPYTTTWAVLCEVFQLVKIGHTITLRDLYYQIQSTYTNPRLINSQTILNEIVNDVSCMLQVSRSSLGLCASSKGYLGGLLMLSLDDGQSTINLSEYPRGLPLSGSIEWNTVTMMPTQARCVIVVEKEGIFHRLMEDKFFLEFPCVIVTGVGFPDLSTRAFLFHLKRQLSLPMYCLVDYNPFGASIYFTYKYGSLNMSLESSEYALGCGIRWLGLRCAHFEKYFESNSDTLLPNRADIQPLSYHDESKLFELLKWEHILEDYEIFELREMLKRKQKVELQALFNRMGSHESFGDFLRCSMDC